MPRSILSDVFAVEWSSSTLSVRYRLDRFTSRPLVAAAAVGDALAVAFDADGAVAVHALDDRRVVHRGTVDRDMSKFRWGIRVSFIRAAITVYAYISGILLQFE